MENLSSFGTAEMETWSGRKPFFGKTIHEMDAIRKAILLPPIPPIGEKGDFFTHLVCKESAVNFRVREEKKICGTAKRKCTNLFQEVQRIISKNEIL